ncbi:hypothetical protein HY489_03180 [Candidatus Woesearchaeota archaeon]|nr:hypothetical protein [Candidatus Woesearchaeota archaeon]
MTIKPDLQERLEAEGWRLLVNESPSMEFVVGVRNRYWVGRPSPLSDEELGAKYLHRGFPEVRIEDAYDVNGKPVINLRAVYVRGERVPPVRVADEKVPDALILDTLMLGCFDGKYAAPGNLEGRRQ